MAQQLWALDALVEYQCQVHPEPTGQSENPRPQSFDGTSGLHRHCMPWYILVGKHSSMCTLKFHWTNRLNRTTCEALYNPPAHCWISVPDTPFPCELHSRNPSVCTVQLTTGCLWTSQLSCRRQDGPMIGKLAAVTVQGQSTLLKSQFWGLPG